jgi:hypothetical protein
VLAGAGGEDPAEVANETVGHRKFRAAGEEPHRDGWLELGMAALDSAALKSLTDPADRLDQIAESLKPFTASRLPAHQLDVMVLRGLYDVTPENVSALLGSPLAAVRSDKRPHRRPLGVEAPAGRLGLNLLCREARRCRHGRRQALHDRGPGLADRADGQDHSVLLRHRDRAADGPQPGRPRTGVHAVHRTLRAHTPQQSRVQ